MTGPQRAAAAFPKAGIGGNAVEGAEDDGCAFFLRRGFTTCAVARRSLWSNAAGFGFLAKCGCTWGFQAPIIRVAIHVYFHWPFVWRDDSTKIKFHKWEDVTQPHPSALAYSRARFRRIGEVQTGSIYG